MQTTDYYARIAAIDERRAGFWDVVNALLALDRRTGTIPPDLAADVQAELDADTPCPSIVAMIEAAS